MHMYNINSPYYLPLKKIFYYLDTQISFKKGAIDCRVGLIILQEYGATKEMDITTPSDKKVLL